MGLKHFVCRPRERNERERVRVSPVKNKLQKFIQALDILNRVRLSMLINDRYCFIVLRQSSSSVNAQGKRKNSAHQIARLLLNSKLQCTIPNECDCGTLLRRSSVAVFIPRAECDVRRERGRGRNASVYRFTINKVAEFPKADDTPPAAGRAVALINVARAEVIAPASHAAVIRRAGEAARGG